MRSSAVTFRGKLNSYLRHARVARLATLNADGSIHTVPLVFSNDSRFIYSVIDAKPKQTKNLRRLANIERSGRATFLIDQYFEDWTKLSFVIIYAEAKIYSTKNKDRNVKTKAIRLLKQKYSQYRTDHYLPTDWDSLIVVRLKPLKIVFWKAKK